MLMLFLLFCCSVALYIMDFPHIPKDFDSVEGASFDFNDFIFETGNAEAV